jgi:hypothetical protein
MRNGRWAWAVQVVAAFAVSPGSLAAQLPLAPIRASGQTVTPAFEGWYRNDDGSYSLSFGYFNRNSEEVLDIPIGPDNYFEPGPRDRGQPTHFETRRHWGVFTVRVPADFGDGRVVWTLVNRGETSSIPGSLRPEWQIDALEGEAGSGNTPPVIRFGESGPEGRGPAGVSAGPFKAVPGQPLRITVWAADDGRSAGSIAGNRSNVPITLTWFEHQGRGSVTFEPSSARVPVAGGSATTAVTFSAPGDYVIRVRANDASGVESAGHAQCCWTNGFVRVSVANH